jgi:hypothetical protein
MTEANFYKLNLIISGDSEQNDALQLGESKSMMWGMIWLPKQLLNMYTMIHIAVGT